MSWEGTPWTPCQKLSLFQELDGGTMFFFPPNRVKECGQAAIIFLQITSWTFPLICFSKINDPFLLCSRKFSSLHADKYTHIHHWPTFYQAAGCTFWLFLINILISSYQIIMETLRVTQARNKFRHARMHRH